ncbi:MAG: LCP family protein [Thermoleophilia bacterium]|nr:LCP family protein [Thermoleophilia bacterium]
MLLLGAAGGSYLWFRSQVAGANERVPDEVRAVLTDKPSSTATTTATTARRADSTTTTAPESPSAMHLLVLGSDHREDEEGEPSRSDTIMLVNIDPDHDYLSVMSIPRDLRVNVPGYGFNKINYAYFAGGPALTIKTVEQLTGIDINHYLEIDFNAFRDITDSIGGVYVDVDRRYYNDNPNYELMKLAPGYQLLDGDHALDYVRYRRDKNLDFGRMERQQVFLTAVREQAMGWDLAFKLPGVVSALFSNVTTTLSANEVLKLTWWGVRLDGGKMRRVTIVGDAHEQDGVSYVFVDDEGIAAAVNDFLTVPDGSVPATSGSSGSAPGSNSTTLVAAPSLKGLEVDVLNANGRAGEAAAAGQWLGSLGAEVVTVGNAGMSVDRTSVEYPSGKADEGELVAGVLQTDSSDWNDARERVTIILGDDFALPSDYALPPGPNTISGAGGWKKIAGMVPFAVRGPAHIPEGYFFVERMPVEGATYDIDGDDDGDKPAFKMLYRLKQHGQWMDQYMGITETTWLDAPAACDGRKVERGGTTFTIVGTADKVERVWWKADSVLYWVSNTLFHLLSGEELLAVAESMILIPPE